MQCYIPLLAKVYSHVLLSQIIIIFLIPVHVVSFQLHALPIYKYISYFFVNVIHATWTSPSTRASTSKVLPLVFCAESMDILLISKGLAIKLCRQQLNMSNLPLSEVSVLTDLEEAGNPPQSTATEPRIRQAYSPKFTSKLSAMKNTILHHL